MDEGKDSINWPTNKIIYSTQKKFCIIYIFVDNLTLTNNSVTIFRV